MICPGAGGGGSTQLPETASAVFFMPIGKPNLVDDAPWWMETQSHDNHS